MKRHHVTAVALLSAAIVAGPAAGMATAAPTAPGERDPNGGPGALDVLFISAHPDDEAGSLATLGQWKQKHDIRAGVVTVTRGEGGGNAVGQEEGPGLGIIREREERTAVGMAGVRDVYNLDKVDFWYTASAPLTERIWNHDDSLARVVRIIRQTRPGVVMTMNPSPTPGNHGNHQQAARFAAEAFAKAGDPGAFPEQISKEGLKPWQPGRLFRSGADGTGPTGPDCATGFRATEPTDRVFGVWPGVRGPSGKTWAQVQAEAGREYKTQGWGENPDAPSDPQKIACSYYTQIGGRVPYDPSDTSPEAMLRGAVLPPSRGGLPMGTQLHVTTDAFRVVPGMPFRATVHARAGNMPLTSVSVRLDAPDGWRVTGDGALGKVGADKESTATFTVTPPSGAALNKRAGLSATMTANQGTGRTDQTVETAAPVRGTLRPLPEVAKFREWAAGLGQSQLDALLPDVAAVGLGQSRTVQIDVRNSAAEPRSGQVKLALPDGFKADATTKKYGPLAPGAAGTVSFTVTNTDTSLKPGVQGGEDGSYPFTITTTSDSGQDTRTGTLNLVPTTSVPRAEQAPKIDGVAAPGEYTGPELDVSPRWEGDPVDGPQDASGKARLTFTDDALYVLVDVTDDVPGGKVKPADCKRHRRTDAVEIDIDPKGGSENTSTVFKSGIFPVTDDPANGDPPCFERDADNRQGPGEETAPGMEVASKVTSPYKGYTIEAKIPFSVLPDAVDPARMGLNILVYDSDNQKLIAGSRIGWSAFPGVRADPYRYGIASLPGYSPPQREATKPAIPDTAAASVDSPQSIAQAVRTGVALSGRPALPTNALRARPAPTGSAGVGVRLRASRAGTAHLFTWDGERQLGGKKVELAAGKETTVTVPESGGTASSVLVAFEDDDGTISQAVPVNR